MNDQISPAPSVGNVISISCPADKFGEFITGLLGKPEVKSRILRGNLDVNRDDIIGCHHLIEQRIKEQNEATLVQFIARVVYDDDTAVEISRLGDFENYAEVRAVTTKIVSVTWVYLIRFRDSQTPERQQIELFFQKNTKYDKDDHTTVTDSFAEAVKKLHGTGYIEIKISHTRRSWGLDMEGLLSDHLRNFLPPRIRPIPRTLSDYSSLFGTISGFCAAFLCAALGQSILTIARQSSVTKLAQLSTMPFSIESLNNKADFALSISIGNDSIFTYVGITIFVFMSMGFSGWFGSWIQRQALHEYPTVIRMTRADDVQIDNDVKEFNRTWMTGGLSFIGSVIAGVISSIIFISFW